MAERATRSGGRWAWVVAAALAALALGLFVAQSLRQAGEAGRDASALLAISLPDTEGREQPLAQWRGKLLVVNFWATWCAPCREEMPLFMRAQAEHGGRGLQFVGIAVDDAAKVRQFAEELKLNYPALIGGYGAMALSQTLGNNLMALPFTVVVDRSGSIALTHLGPLRPEQLDKVLKEML